MLVKARYEFADVLFDLGARQADERCLNVVPKFQRLRLHGAVTVGARVECSRRWCATGGLGLDGARKRDAPDERRAEKQVRPLSKMLTLVRGGVDLVFKLPEV